jgi:hypothetical protein
VSSELHEAINAVIIDQTWVTYERVGQDAVVAGTGLAADAILAMPQMQAIRAALLTAIDESPLGCPYLLQNGAEGAYGPNTCNRGCRDEPECITFGYPRLCESVIDWVLGGPS